MVGMLMTFLVPGFRSWLAFVPELQETPLAARRCHDVLTMAMELGEEQGGCCALLFRPDGTMGVRTYVSGEPSAWVCYPGGKPLDNVRLCFTDAVRGYRNVHSGPYAFGL